MTLLEAISARHSVRRYTDRPLDADVIALLTAKIEEINTAGRLHAQLVTYEPKAFRGGFAYGSFRGVTDYIIMAGEKGADLDERIGYYGQELVVYAQTLGLNTCWVGLTYNKVSGTCNLAPGEKIVCYIALGYGESQGSPHKKKSIEQLGGVTADSPEWYRRGMEAAAMSPSAVNQLKWRFRCAGVDAGGRGVVECDRGRSLIGYTAIDLGIAKYNFEIGAAPVKIVFRQPSGSERSRKTFLAFGIALGIALAGLMTSPAAEASDSTPAELMRRLQGGGTVEQADVHAVLHQLDREVNRRNEYRARRVARIDSLGRLRRATAERSPSWFRHTMEIGQAFGSFNNDSALKYLYEGYEAARAGGNDSTEISFRIRLAPALSMGGYVTDALTALNEVDTVGLSLALLRSYYAQARQTYSYVANYYDGLGASRDNWNTRMVESQERLLPLLEKGSDEFQLNQGEYLFNTHQLARSRTILLDLVGRLDPDSPQYAIATHILAQIAAQNGRRNEQVLFLALSAMSDTRRSNLEVMSIQELGGLLFEQGDTKRAHNYLVMAMNNAVDSRASVRLSQTSQLLTVIENDHLLQIRRYRRITTTALCILAVCLLAMVAGLWFLRRQLHRLDRLKQHLEVSNKAKEVYMSRFMSLCSIYMDKLKQFSKLANRKISAGQVDELYKLTKSGKFVEEQSREFYLVFDDAFLHIYPDFLEKVNALLRPEERITLEDGELLNSDLRILAFMKLGIDDAPRIAHILNYSVNTIYAYRNKLRNKAINRDTFEADILAI